MNCRKARTAIDERSLGRLSPGRTLELETHLGLCPACASVERADRWISDELALLRGRIPYALDVRRRVMIEIERFGPMDRHEVSAWQLAWATAIAGLGALALVTLLWGSWSGWLTGLENTWALARGLTDVSFTLVSVLVSMISIPFKLIAGLQDLWMAIPSAAAGLRPFAIVGIALCYLTMAGTIVGIVGRDLRRPATTPARED